MRWAEKRKISIKYHPEIYTDGYLLLEDRNPQEVKKWQNETSSKYHYYPETEYEYQNVKNLYPEAETKPVEFLGFTEGESDSVPYAHLNIGNEYSEMINAEYYKWLTKEGYVIKSTGIEYNPLVLERGGKDVGVLMPIKTEKRYYVNDLKQMENE